jgi:hydroxyethylthiazole kinase-like uncharacterized protein yjeF
MTPLPAWMTPLPDAAQQRAIDAWAIEERSIPSLDLMEHAGGALADLVETRAPNGRIAVVCGKGNNGGDGLVAARWLRGRGREVDVLLLVPGEELTGDARANLERLPGEAPRLFTSEALTGASAIVDAIFGTGFSGEPRDRLRRAKRSRRIHGRGRGQRRSRASDRHVLVGQAGAVDRPGEGPRG